MEPATIAAIGAVAGKAVDVLSGERAARKNRQMQQQFAQQGIQWKVADAKAAGLHPLAALGAQTHAASPVYVGGSFGELGQDISRAVIAGSDHQQRDALGEFAAQKVKESDARVFQQQYQDVQLQREKVGLERDIVMRDMAAWQLRQMQLPGTPPAVPVGGARTNTGVPGQVKVEPSTFTSREVGRPQKTAGSGPFYQEFQVAPGWTMLGMSKEASEAFEGSELAAAITAAPALLGGNLAHLREQIGRRADAWLNRYRKALGGYHGRESFRGQRGY